jgi:hypothetical protein
LLSACFLVRAFILAAKLALAKSVGGPFGCREAGRTVAARKLLLPTKPESSLFSAERGREALGVEAEEAFRPLLRAKGGWGLLPFAGLRDADGEVDALTLALRLDTLALAEEADADRTSMSSSEV